MAVSLSVEDLFDSHVVPQDHAKSDYFGLIKKLVGLRNNYSKDSEEFLKLQTRIDQVYESVLDELINNQGRPVSRVKFGTSGWRGILGKDLFLKSVRLVTMAIIEMYRELSGLEINTDFVNALGVGSYQEAQKRGCVVGFDNRFGGEIMARGVVDVLTANGFSVHYAGEATTGTLSATLIQVGAAFSINLTPSHNPLEYGGVKYNAADGGPAASILTDKITQEAEQLINSDELSSSLAAANPDPALVHPVDALECWIGFVKKNSHLHGLHYDEIMEVLAKTDDLVVAIDCVHGASRLHMKKIFEKANIDRFILLRGDADPTFGGIAPEPSSANIKPVAATLSNRPEFFKLGAIIDPDGDRVRFTDGKNEISMNQFGAMAYHYLHEIKKKKGMVAKTVATSNFVNSIASALEEEVFESRVGFKEFKPVLGSALVCFEESDGITVIGHTAEKDAYIGLILALEMVLTLRKNLGDYLRDLEDSYGHYFPAASSVAVSQHGEMLMNTLAALEKYTIGTMVEVGEEERRIKNIIAIDGRKMILEDDSWIMIRPSGTEPKVRFYVEARSEKDKTSLFETARGMLAEIGLL